MKGVWLIIHKQRKEVVATTDAPADIDKAKLIRHWVAMQGLTEAADKGFTADWCPITKWKGHLAEVFTPMGHRE